MTTERPRPTGTGGPALLRPRPSSEEEEGDEDDDDGGGDDDEELAHQIGSGQSLIIIMLRLSCYITK